VGTLTPPAGSCAFRCGAFLAGSRGKSLRGFGVGSPDTSGADCPRGSCRTGAKGAYDLLVVGAKGRSDIPFLPTGSVALALLEQHLPANVLLVRERKVPKEERVAIEQRPFVVLFPTDGSSRLESVARSFFRSFSAPDLRPIAVAVAELPEPAALAGMEVEDRKRLIRQLMDAAGRWAREAKPLLARPGIRPQAPDLARQGRGRHCRRGPPQRCRSDRIGLGAARGGSAAGPLGGAWHCRLPALPRAPS
jgi:hypothetical protein